MERKKSDFIERRKRLRNGREINKALKKRKKRVKVCDVY